MTTFAAVINYSFYIFEHNFLEFEKAIDSYTEELYSQGIRAFDLKNRDFQAQRFEVIKRETARLLHNYLASWYTLKQQTYAARNSLEQSPTNDSLITDIKNKKGEMFNDNPKNAFIQDLRNYIQHRSLPLIESQNSISFKFEQPDFDVNHSLYLDTNKLLEWKKWNAQAEKYLSEQAEKLAIKETIKSNFSHLQSFYQWLSQRINS
jgi:hypothetical protein